MTSDRGLFGALSGDHNHSSTISLLAEHFRNQFFTNQISFRNWIAKTISLAHLLQAPSHQLCRLAHSNILIHTLCHRLSYFSSSLNHFANSRPREKLVWKFIFYQQVEGNERQYDGISREMKWKSPLKPRYTSALNVVTHKFIFTNLKLEEGRGRDRGRLKIEI